MKLAEALMLRADTQKQIEQLKYRLIRHAKVQEGETPPENPQALLSELEGSINELQNLIQRINKTNALTSFQGSITVADALAQRDMLMLKRGAYTALIEAASYRHDRYTRSEVKSFSTVNVAELQSEVDRLSREYRELDARIQALNWAVDVVD